MSKNTNLSFLTDFLTADIVNSRVGMNNVSPQATFDVTGTGKFSGILTLGSTVSNGTYTYTLPSATGTLALTSDIPSVSGYVPYTGATQAVDLGTNDLTSRYVVANGSPALGGVISMKQDAAYIAKGNGYSSIASSFNSFDFFGYTGASTYKNFQLRFDGLTNNTLRTYTLPDADGTIALVGGSGVGTVTSVAAITLGTSGTDLTSTVANGTTTPVITLNVPDASVTARGVITTGTQYIAGLKIFTSTIVANVDLQLPAAGTASTTFIKNISGSGLTSIGSNGFGFNNSDNIYFSGSNKAGGVFAFNNTGNRTYTLQDASGTLAFTSEIPTNAVGGTGTLNTIPKFTAATTIGNSNIFDSGSIIYNTNPAAGTFAWQFNGSTVTGQSYGAQVIAGTNASDIGFKVMNAAASINYLVVRGDGLVTLTGALNGTSAGFTGAVTSDDLILTAGTLFGAGNTGFSNRLSDTTLYLQMPATGFNITDNALNTRFILSSTGEATFSRVPMTNQASYNYQNIRVTSGFGGGYVDAKIQSLLAAYDGNIYGADIGYSYDGGGVGNTGYSLRFSTNDDLTGNPIERLRINSTGAAIFSSSVTATNLILSAVNSVTVSAGQATINSIYAGTDGNWITLQNAGGIFYSGLENSVGNSFGATPYAGVLFLSGARNFEFFTGNTRKMTLNSGGNLGIGTDSIVASSGYKMLRINGATTGGEIVLAGAEVEYGYMYASAGIFVIDALASQPMRFRTGAENRMDITSSGNVLIGTTTDNGSKLQVSGIATFSAGIELSGTITNFGTGTGVYTRSTWYNDTSNQILFENARQTDSSTGIGRTVYFTWRGGPSVGGGVQLQHGTNAWAAYTSDARLKTKVADIENGIDAIMKLIPIKFKWSRELENSRTVTGFTAQNVGEAIPDAVFNSWKDVELGDVKSYYQDYLIPYLVKAIQEQQVQIDKLKNS